MFGCGNGVDKFLPNQIGMGNVSEFGLLNFLSHAVLKEHQSGVDDYFITVYATCHPFEVLFRGSCVVEQDIEAVTRRYQKPSLLYILKSMKLGRIMGNNLT